MKLGYILVNGTGKNHAKWNKPFSESQGSNAFSHIQKRGKVEQWEKREGEREGEKKYCDWIGANYILDVYYYIKMNTTIMSNYNAVLKTLKNYNQEKMAKRNS